MDAILILLGSPVDYTLGVDFVVARAGFLALRSTSPLSEENALPRYCTTQIGTMPTENKLEKR